MSAVLAVVLMVLKIIGMILLALLLLLLLALLLPAGIHFRWSHIGGLRLQLCNGPLHFTLYPRKADEEEKKEEPKAETKQGNTPKTEPTSAAPPKPTSRKKIPALWTASKRQSGRTLLAMCGTCSACCAPVWGRYCAASASAS